jgi:hypothetical protein
MAVFKNSLVAPLTVYRYTYIKLSGNKMRKLKPSKYNNRYAVTAYIPQTSLDQLEELREVLDDEMTVSEILRLGIVSVYSKMSLLSALHKKQDGVETCSADELRASCLIELDITIDTIKDLEVSEDVAR